MPTNIIHTETELATLTSKGDEAAFTHLYSIYQPVVFHYIKLFTQSEAITQELVQDVFLRLWDNKEKLRDAPVIKAYILRIAKNLVIDHIRHEQVKFKVLAQLRQAPQHHDDSLAYRQLFNLTQKAIQALPEKRKLIFRLSTEHGLSLDEIANRLQISKSVVKKQLYSATESVRNYLHHHGDVQFAAMIVTASFCMQ